MLDSEKLAVAAHLHVVMRRKIGRVTDVEWMIRNPEYAREVIRLALVETAHPELAEWGQRLQAVLFPVVSTQPPPPAGAAADRHEPPSGYEDGRPNRPAQPAPTTRYVGSLR